MQYLCGKNFQMKILGMGNALIDVLAKLDADEILTALNLAKGSMQLVDVEQRNHIFSRIQHLPQEMTAGGCASNTLAALAKLGLYVGFVGKAGNDAYGKFYLQDLNTTGVHTHIIQEQASSGTAMVLISPGGERTFGTYLGVSAELSAADLSEDVFRKYNYFYIEGYLVQNPELITSAIKMAKRLGMKVVIDAASYNVVEANKDFFRQMIDEYVDIVFANEEEARALTGLENPQDAIRRIAEKTEIAVVKIGAKGALAMRGDELVNVPAIQTTVVDTTAAGDYYAAGFIYGLSKNLSLTQCAQSGALLAAHIIAVVGTRLNDHSWQQIKQELLKY
jgi:sugar/nucleoside kinase (ribokinase family)